jgi:hypothetical protein
MLNRLIIPGAKIDLENKVKATTISSKSESVLSLQKRSKGYINFLTTLENIDAYKLNGYEELTNQISKEIGPLGMPSSPIGILAKCYLGAPYDVHILGLEGEIILNHYKVSEPLPPDFSKARNLAIHNQYAIVEVYKDKFVLIDSDGNTTNLKS